MSKLGRISSMAPNELYSGSFRWFPFTIIFALRLACFSVPIIILAQRADSSAVLLNKTGALVPPKPHQKSFEIHKRLRAINKPAVKTILSPDGDIIDCILRHRQPAFDDPLLRNHTIQEFATIPSGFRPSSMTNGTLKRPFQNWHLTGVRCPKGTIPTRRVSAEDLMRYDPHRLYEHKKFPDRLGIPQKPADDDGRDFAREYATVAVEGAPYYGTAMIANVWNPRLEEYGDTSIAQLWIIADFYAGPGLNSIEVGWQVNQRLYGDTRTRLFNYWTRDKYRTTGCYNIECPGFVQTSDSVALGSAFSTVSLYDKEQVELLIFVWKDTSTGNWWLYLQNYGRIGYWPSDIFTDLANHADRVEWGGEVGYFTESGEHSIVYMGSGQFANTGFRKASYIRNLKVVKADNAVQDAGAAPQQKVTNSRCYNLRFRTNNEWGKHFFFGGPGRNRICP